jgi:site-specific DNA recombinase
MEDYQYEPTGRYLGKRAAMYRRLSGESQEDGWSLQFQEEKISEAIALEGCTLEQKHNYKEIHTGMEIFERPKLTALRAAAKQGEFDVLFLYKLDRFSRVGWQQEMMREELRRHGVTIVTLKKDEHADDDSPLGALIRSFYGFKAEEERNDIVQRTSDGRATKLSNGHLVGGGAKLYGYRWNANGKARTHYVIYKPEARIVRYIFWLYKRGLTLRQIAIILTEREIPTPQGKRDTWSISTVKQILNNSSYIGKAAFNKLCTVKEPGGKKRTMLRPEEEWIVLPEGVVPRLVDLAIFEQVQQRLIHNQQCAARKNKNPEGALLRCGLVRCGYCGHTMHVKSNNSKCPVYQCNRRSALRGQCESPTISIKKLDAAVWERAVEIIRNPVLVTEQIEKQRRADPTKENRKTIKKRLAEIPQEIENSRKSAREARNEKARAMFLKDVDDLIDEQEGLEKMLKDERLQQEAWKKEQKKLDEFVQWCHAQQELLDDPNQEFTYEEKRNACERLGLKALVWRHDHKPQYQIESLPPQIVFNMI